MEMIREVVIFFHINFLRRSVGDYILLEVLVYSWRHVPSAILSQMPNAPPMFFVSLWRLPCLLKFHNPLALSKLK